MTTTSKKSFVEVCELVKKNADLPKILSRFVTAQSRISCTPAKTMRTLDSWTLVRLISPREEVHAPPCTLRWLNTSEQLKCSASSGTYRRNRLCTATS